MSRTIFVVQAAALCASLAVLSSCSGRSDVNEPVRTYQMGERVPLLPITYSVFEKQWYPQFGTAPDIRLPQNRFLVIRISATNGGSSEVYVPNLTLEDDAGNTCNEVSNGDGVPHWLGFLRNVKPADTLQGNILFDCAPKHYRLKMVNEEDKVAYVDIPLSFEGDNTAPVALPNKDDKSSKLVHPK